MLRTALIFALASMASAFVAHAPAARRTTHSSVVSMFFGPKGDPVAVTCKTMKGTTTYKGVSDQPFEKVRLR